MTANTRRDYLKHKNEGHSSAFNALQLAAEKAQAKKLILTHHDPTYSDEVLIRSRPNSLG